MKNYQNVRVGAPNVPKRHDLRIPTHGRESVIYTQNTQFTRDGRIGLRPAKSPQKPATQKIPSPSEMFQEAVAETDAGGLFETIRGYGETVLGAAGTAIKRYGGAAVKVGVAAGVALNLSNFGAFADKYLLDGHPDATVLEGVSFTGYKIAPAKGDGIPTPKIVPIQTPKDPGISKAKDRGIPKIDPKNSDLNKQTKLYKKNGFTGGVASAAPYTPPEDFPVPEHPEKKVGEGSQLEFYFNMFKDFFKNGLADIINGYHQITGKASVKNSTKKEELTCPPEQRVLIQSPDKIGLVEICQVSAPSEKHDLVSPQNNGGGGVEGGVSGVGSAAFDKDVVYKEIYRDDVIGRSSILSTSIGAKGEDVFLKMLLKEDYDLNKYPITIDAGAMDSNSGALRFEFLVNESAVKVFERPLAKIGKWGEPQETQKYSAELSNSGKEISIKFKGMYHLIKQKDETNAIGVSLNVENNLGGGFSHRVIYDKI